MPSRQRSARSLSPVSPQAPLASARHKVRIIGGKWRRSVLTVVAAEGLRPTPDRVRETVFNWLTHFKPAGFARMAVLDLFAGTGALGLEAASRGAACVVLVEQHGAAAAALLQLRTRLKAQQVSVLRTDALHYLDASRQRKQRFDLVFLDPPFGFGWLARVLPLLPSVLNPQALVYVESDQDLREDQAAAMGYERLRADKAGQVFYHLLRRNIDVTVDEPTIREEPSC